jgi:hypothetical protein
MSTARCKYGLITTVVNCGRYRLFSSERLDVAITYGAVIYEEDDTPPRFEDRAIRVSAMIGEFQPFDATFLMGSREQAEELFLRADPVRLFELLFKQGDSSVESPNSFRAMMSELDPLPETSLTEDELHDLFNPGLRFSPGEEFDSDDED